MQDQETGETTRYVGLRAWVGQNVLNCNVLRRNSIPPLWTKLDGETVSAYTVPVGRPSQWSYRMRQATFETRYNVAASNMPSNKQHLRRVTICPTQLPQACNIPRTALTRAKRDLRDRMPYLHTLHYTIPLIPYRGAERRRT